MRLTSDSIATEIDELIEKIIICWFRYLEMDGWCCFQSDNEILWTIGLFV